MKLWCAYRRHNDFFCKVSGQFDRALLHIATAASIARHRGVPLGLIATREDADYLRFHRVHYASHIEVEWGWDIRPSDIAVGAVTKLQAIAHHVPGGDALCDMDVLWTAGPPVIDPVCAVALNYEPLAFYADYRGHEGAVAQCRPQGNQTINAGLLYMPAPHFRRYARLALELAKKLPCIGHTFEQMFFVRYAQDNGLPLTPLYPARVRKEADVERCYESTGIRHPFCYKNSLLEIQRCIDIGKEFAEPNFVRLYLKTFFPHYLPMLEARLFSPL